MAAIAVDLPFTLPDAKQYFAVCMKCDERIFTNNHFHFRCTSCQTIECLPDAVHFSVTNGYNVESVNFVLTGTCPLFS